MVFTLDKQTAVVALFILRSFLVCATSFLLSAAPSPMERLPLGNLIASAGPTAVTWI